MKQISKFLSFILRHNPQAGGLTLSEDGWASTQSVLDALERRFGSSSFEELLDIVDSNDKKRFAFDETKDRIRASQGHSVDVDLGMTAVAPPSILYHGTKSQFLDSIEDKGLIKGTRNHVHLSPDIETAYKVANRRKGDSIILEIRTEEMEGHEFFLSANGVWLTDHVPPESIYVLRA